MAFRCLSPLSGLITASLPHVFEASGYPSVPNPILESHEPQLFLFSLTIPILALECPLRLQTTLKPSFSQLYCNDPCEPINSFHLSRPSKVARYCPSAISENRVSLLVDDNEPELLSDLHAETDLGEGCVPVGGYLWFLSVEPSLSFRKVVSFIITPVRCIIAKSGLKKIKIIPSLFLWYSSHRQIQ